MTTRLVTSGLAHSLPPSIRQTNFLWSKTAGCIFVTQSVINLLPPKFHIFWLQFFPPQNMNVTFTFAFIFSWLLWGEGHIKTLWPCSCPLQEVLWSALGSTQFSSCQSPGVREKNWKAEVHILIFNKENWEGRINSITSSIYLQFFKRNSVLVCSGYYNKILQTE